MVSKSLNILELSSLIWKNRLLLFTFSFLLSVFFAIYSFTIPNKYRSESVHYSKNEDVQNSNNLPLSGLANLTGLGISVSESGNLINLSIEAIKSKDFFEYLIDKDDSLLPLLNAVKRFDKNSDIIIFDEATNALDILTEQKILNNINKKKITIIQISHRLNTLEGYDIIIKL